MGDAKIKIFNLDGKYLSAVGGYGKELGQFVRPKGIAVDKSDILYVTDAGFENVLRSYQLNYKAGRKSAGKY